MRYNGPYEPVISHGPWTDCNAEYHRERVCPVRYDNTRHDDGPVLVSDYSAYDLLPERRNLASLQGYRLRMAGEDRRGKPICRLSMKKETGKQDE